jgi:hypothetical protein
MKDERGKRRQSDADVGGLKGGHLFFLGKQGY